MNRRTTGWIAGLVAGLAVLVGGSGIAAAAPTTTYPGKIGLELVVLLPHQHQLDVYQQVSMSQISSNPWLGIIPGHGTVSPINVSLAHVGKQHVVVLGTPSAMAIKYTLPWDGRSGLFTLHSYEATSGLVVMVPMSMNLPPVLNPNWQTLAPRKIPGLPNSPTFRVYATNNILAGASVAFSVSTGAAVTQSVPAAGFPRAGVALRFLTAIVLLGALALVVNWSPLKPLPADGIDQESLLARLANIEAQHRAQELSDEDYRTERGAVLSELERHWQSRAG